MYIWPYVSNPSRLLAGLSRRIKRLLRLRPSHAISSLKTLSSREIRAPQGPSALLIEPNEFHAETLPGYVSLLAAAGFRVTILHRPGLDVVGALSRLPRAQQPILKTAMLTAMGWYLRGNMPSRFNFLVFNSATIADDGGYFGNVIDYIGRFPEGRKGAILIEHAVEMLFSEGILKENPYKKYFALRPIDLLEDVTLPMLAPVEFGSISRPTLGIPLKFIAVGRMMAAYRSLLDLFNALESIATTKQRPFEVHLIGAGRLESIPERVRPLIRFHGQLPFEQMYKAVEDAHIFLPLLDSRVPEHRQYLDHVTSGSRQLILGFEKVSIWERSFASKYGFDESSAIIHETGDLTGGLKAAFAMDQKRYARIIEEVARRKRHDFNLSLSNLLKVLGTS